MKNGFRVLDSDLHTMEPDGLWERYLDAPFKKFAPKFVRGTHNAPNQPVIQIGDLAIAEMYKRTHTAVVGKDLQRRAFERSPHYQIAHDRGYDSEENVAKSKGRAVKRQRTANTQDFFGLESDDESADEEDKGQTEVKGKRGKQSKSEQPASDDEHEDEDEKAYPDRDPSKKKTGEF